MTLDTPVKVPEYFLILCHGYQRLPGYLPGFSQPALVAHLEIGSGPGAQRCIEAFDAQAAQHIAGLAATNLPMTFAAHPLLQGLARGALGLLRAAGLTVTGEAALFFGSPGQVDLALSASGLTHAATITALEAIVQLMNRLVTGEIPEAAWLNLTAAKESLRRLAPPGQNTRHFLQAAQAAGIPWRPLGGNVYQFGWGARARCLDSSFTERTSFIGARFAGDKLQTARLLRLAGLPTPRHALAADAADAVKIAESLGYPIVVKPADLDAGHGVAAGLVGAERVIQAFERARALSPRVLVEKHVDGNDYRLQVYQGVVFWVAHRMPASITGDGTSTVRLLLERTNTQRRAAALTYPPSGLKPIALDEEALGLLLEQGLALDEVPAEARWVRLRRAANVASGGVPVPMLEEAHPDNLALAVRAARILRLDIAGIDLLMPDIRISWLDSAAVICEVNAQPQLSSHLPAYLLARLVEGQGRIPVVLILGQPTEASELEAWKRAMSTTGRCLGLATAAGLWVGDTPVAGVMDVFQGVTALLVDPAVESVMLLVEDTQFQRSGAPVDRIDVLILAGPLKSTPGHDKAYPEALAQMLASMSARVVVNAHCTAWQSTSAEILSPTAISALLEEMMRRN